MAYTPSIRRIYTATSAALYILIQFHRHANHSTTATTRGIWIQKRRSIFFLPSSFRGQIHGQGHPCHYDKKRLEHHFQQIPDRHYISLLNPQPLFQAGNVLSGNDNPFPIIQNGFKPAVQRRAEAFYFTQIQHHRF